MSFIKQALPDTQGREVDRGQRGRERESERGENRTEIRLRETKRRRGMENEVQRQGNGETVVWCVSVRV